jgi:hypothetical protein
VFEVEIDQSPSSLLNVELAQTPTDAALDRPQYRALPITRGVCVVKVPGRRREAGVTVDGREIPCERDHHGVDLHLIRRSPGLRSDVESSACGRRLASQEHERVVEKRICGALVALGDAFAEAYGFGAIPSRLAHRHSELLAMLRRSTVGFDLQKFEQRSGVGM